MLCILDLEQRRPSANSLPGPRPSTPPQEGFGGTPPELMNARFAPQPHEGAYQYPQGAYDKHSDVESQDHVPPLHTTSPPMTVGQLQHEGCREGHPHGGSCCCDPDSSRPHSPGTEGSVSRQQMNADVPSPHEGEADHCAQTDVGSGTGRDPSPFRCGERYGASKSKRSDKREMPRPLNSFSGTSSYSRGRNSPDFNRASRSQQSPIFRGVRQQLRGFGDDDGVPPRQSRVGDHVSQMQNFVNWWNCALPPQSWGDIYAPSYQNGVGNYCGPPQQNGYGELVPQQPNEIDNMAFLNALWALNTPGGLELWSKFQDNVAYPSQMHGAYGHDVPNIAYAGFAHGFGQGIESRMQRGGRHVQEAQPSSDQQSFRLEDNQVSA